ncbi:hypothetical protein PanWU01x14_320490 [Parasponia andersonii]|uniref:Uncharacterized protein n=1 Tax=Parasponia andersonii TaxID=3476 RepID=A0A2P5ALJ6_PARAD|nr:hypothetical protein PanWU01x14_320490 [Parasponia andersonii]
MRKIHFDIGGKCVRFELCEFAPTKGLNFRKYPNSTKLKTMIGSRRLVKKYMNDSKIIKSGVLEPIFLNYGDVEYEWKLEEKDFHGSIMTSIHSPRVDHGIDESVRDPNELDANEEHLKETKATDETTKVAGIFLSHEPEVGDKNPKLGTLASSSKKLQADVDELKANQLENKQNQVEIN